MDIGWIGVRIAQGETPTPHSDFDIGEVEDQQVWQRTQIVAQILQPPFYSRETAGMRGHTHACPKSLGIDRRVVGIGMAPEKSTADFSAEPADEIGSVAQLLNGGMGADMGAANRKGCAGLPVLLALGVRQTHGYQPMWKIECPGQFLGPHLVQFGTIGRDSYKAKIPVHAATGGQQHPCLVSGCQGDRKRGGFGQSRHGVSR